MMKISSIYKRRENFSEAERGRATNEGRKTWDKLNYMLSNSRDNNHKIHPPCRNTTDDTNRKRSYLTAKLFLFVCLDDNIRRRISNTGENPAFLYLVIIKEASIRLIHSPLHNLAKT